MTHCRADAMLLIVLEDAFYLCLTPTFSMFAHSGYKLSFSLNLCPVFYRADKKQCNKHPIVIGCFLLSNHNVHYSLALLLLCY